MYSRPAVLSVARCSDASHRHDFDPHVGMDGRGALATDPGHTHPRVRTDGAGSVGGAAPYGVLLRHDLPLREHRDPSSPRLGRALDRWDECRSAHVCGHRLGYRDLALLDL